MSEWQTVHHAAAIAGLISDAQTARGLRGIVVEVINAPSTFTSWLAARAVAHGQAWSSLPVRPDRTLTAADGSFHLMDLPAGTYRLQARDPRPASPYALMERETTVAADADGQARLSRLDIALNSTRIAGRITRLDDGAPVALARLVVNGSGESAYTDTNGEYLILGLELGVRVLAVSVPGYEPATNSVVLDTTGSLRTLDWRLTAR